jgi:hypothetical protein
LELNPLIVAEGAEAARADIAAGRLVFRWSGNAGHFGHWVVTQIAERFGVGVNEWFGVCVVTEHSLSFNEGYNAVLAQEIDRRHGAGAFKSVFEESSDQPEAALMAARRAWKAQHPRGRPNGLPDQSDL